MIKRKRIQATFTFEATHDTPEGLTRLKTYIRSALDGYMLVDGGDHGTITMSVDGPGRIGLVNTVIETPEKPRYSETIRKVKHRPTPKHLMAKKQGE